MTDDPLDELLATDDPAALRIYADALIQRGDPRGELIVVQQQRRIADSEALAARELELTATLNASLIVAIGQGMPSFRWRDGFVDTIRLSPAPGGGKLGAALRAVRQLAATRRLRRVVFAELGARWHPFGDGYDELVGLAAALPTLRALEFIESLGTLDAAVALGDLAGLLAAWPHLDELRFRGGTDHTLAGATLSSVRVLEHAGARTADIEALANGAAPMIEELALSFVEADFDDTTFRRLLASGQPALRTLRFHASSSLLEYVLRGLPGSRLASTVRTLALTGSIHDVRVLVRAAPRLAHLERIEVDVETLADSNRRRLKEAFGDRLVMPQFTLPMYCIVVETPVTAIRTPDGGMDILAFDRRTGELARDMGYLTKIVLGGDDVTRIDEAAFDERVRQLRASR